MDMTKITATFNCSVPSDMDKDSIAEMLRDIGNPYGLDYKDHEVIEDAETTQSEQESIQQET